VVVVAGDVDVHGRGHADRAGLDLGHDPAVGRGGGPQHAVHQVEQLLRVGQHVDDLGRRGADPDLVVPVELDPHGPTSPSWPTTPTSTSASAAAPSAWTTWPLSSSTWRPPVSRAMRRAAAGGTSRSWAAPTAVTATPDRASSGRR